MDIFIEVLDETIIMLPMLLIMYMILEYSEMHHSLSFEKLQKHGPLLGAILGLIPQCGISVIASLFFLEKKITLGTLMSIYIATSDEAIPLLLSNYALKDTVFYILIIKCLVGILFGYIIDRYITLDIKEKKIEYNEHHHSFIKCVIERTLKIYVFIFLIHLVLSYLFEYIGEDALSTLLLNKSLFQPLLSACFGLIPHCIVSVVLTGLYAKGLLSFASLIAGLMSNAGLGLLALVRYKMDMKDFLKIVGLLLGCSILTGLIMQIMI